MKLHVGSKNKTKIKAVKDATALYPTIFSNPEIISIDVAVPLFGHPKNIQETVEGAIDRAKKAFIDCDYSFGLEGGLVEVPHSKTGFMEVGVCALYDGKTIYLGLGPAFEWPAEVTKLIVSGKADASKAFKDLGYTHEKKLGLEKGGIIGFLTKSRVTREISTKQSIIMALLQLENQELYS